MRVETGWVELCVAANGRLVVAQKGGALGDSCAIRSVEPDGTSIIYREIMGELPSDSRCGTPVLGLHGTAGATASVFYSERIAGTLRSTSRRVWIDAPIVPGELAYRLFATTPTGYAGLLPVGGLVELDGMRLPGSIPTTTFDAAYGGGVVAVLSRTATGGVVSTQRVSAP